MTRNEQTNGKEPFSQKGRSSCNCKGAPHRNSHPRSTRCPAVVGGIPQSGITEAAPSRAVFHWQQCSIVG